MITTVLVRLGLFAFLIPAATMGSACAAASSSAAQPMAASLAVGHAQSAAPVASLRVGFDHSSTAAALDQQLAQDFTAGSSKRAEIGTSPAWAIDSQEAAPSAVPEPATWALLLAGAMGLMVLKRHQLRHRR